MVLDIARPHIFIVFAQMSLNNDFSFVRFLKVVKTLYESSVFTRIGKTVGSELDKQALAKDDETIIKIIIIYYCILF